MLRWTKFIFGLRWLIRMAAHIPMTASVLERRTLVLVAKAKSCLNTGANLESSFSSISQLNCLRSSGFWLCKMELALSDDIHFTSLANSIPTIFNKYFLVVGSFKASTAIFFLLLRAIAFPMCFRLGVSRNVFGVL